MTDSALEAASILSPLHRGHVVQLQSLISFRIGILLRDRLPVEQDPLLLALSFAMNTIDMSLRSRASDTFCSRCGVSAIEYRPVGGKLLCILCVDHDRQVTQRRLAQVETDLSHCELEASAKGYDADTGETLAQWIEALPAQVKRLYETCKHCKLDIASHADACDCDAGHAERRALREGKST